MDPILKKLKDELASTSKEAQAIIAKAEAEDRELTADEQSNVDTLIEHCEDLKQNKIPAREKQIEQRSRLMEFSASSTEPQRIPTRGGALTTGRVEVTKEAYEDDPKGGFKSPREFLTCVMEETRRGKNDDRLRRFATVGSDEHAGYNDAVGGYLIPEGFMSGLLKVNPEADPTSGRTSMVPSMSPRLAIPARTDKTHTNSVSGGLRVYRRAEADTVSSSLMSLERIVLEAHSLMGIAYATDEILTDSPISFSALLADGFGDEFQSKKLNEKISGTGVGEYEGVLNTPALVSVSAETGQDATTIVYENVINMYARFWGMGGGIWLANHNTLPQLMLMNQTIGTGGVPVWQPSAREGVPGTLIGLPIYFTEYCPTLGTVGDLILGNWSQYLEMQLGGTDAASSMHVRFVNHEQTFRFSQRNDGRCWWRSALTPVNGSTLSPFVALATRS